MSKPHSNLSELEKFTRQEKKIMCLILEGCSSLEIASKLAVSTLTIKTHKQNIARKAEVKGSSSLRKFVISTAETLKNTPWLSFLLLFQVRSTKLISVTRFTMAMFKELANNFITIKIRKNEKKLLSNFIRLRVTHTGVQKK